MPSRGPLFEALRNFVDFDTFEALPHFRALSASNSSDYRCADGNDFDELKAIITEMLHREAKYRPTARQSLKRVHRIEDTEFVRNLPGLDAIELDLGMSDTDELSMRRSPENTAPSEFVKTSAKTFRDIGATLGFSPTRRISKKSMRRTPTKSKFITPTKSPSTPERSLFKSPQTPSKTTNKSRTKNQSPLDSLKKVRCRVTQIGHFSEGGRSRKKPRRSRDFVRKDSPSSNRTGSTTSPSMATESQSESPMVSASKSEEGSSHGMSSLWDDDDVKWEANAPQSPAQQRRLSFSPSDTRKGRFAALNSPSETECVRKHQFFGDEEDEKDEEGSSAGLELEFLF